MYDPYMLQQNPYNRYAPVSPANAPISQFQSGGQIVRVNGYQGAQAYQMGANAAAVLFNANQDIFYKKITDGAGPSGSISTHGQTVFERAIAGKDFSDVLPILCDLMSTLEAVNPVLYRKVIERLSEVQCMMYV